MELFLIKELFNTENAIEILKLFRYTSNNKYIKIFLNIFKMMGEEYINNYDFLIIIFNLLKLYKNKYYILKIKNIDIINFFISLEKYLLLLSSKSELLKILLVLGESNIILKDLKLLMIMISKELSNYMTFNQLYNKLFECVNITKYNKNIINENKKKINIYYNEINKNLNDIYDFDNYNKYKVSNEIINYFIYIINNSKKINIIE